MSFQNRLSYFQDRRNARLVCNDITRSGLYLDVIHLTAHRDAQYDERRLTIDSFQFIPVVFPLQDLEGMETRLGRAEEGEIIPHLMTEESSFEVYIDARKGVVTKDDLLFWMVEDYSTGTHSSSPAILLLKVTNLLSHFGSYGITFRGYQCTTSDPSTLPRALRDALKEAFEKRRTEILARHGRTQIE